MNDRSSDTFLGQDVHGNTFWEFKDKLNAQRLRRIVRYSHKPHLGDVNISPQWHQWLRQTRYEPPTLEEQQADIDRQTQLKYLAMKANERWASKPSFLDKSPEQPKPATLSKDSGGYPQATESLENEANIPTDASAADPEPPRPTKGPGLRKQARSGGPSENWQPESWSPGPAKKR